jgi:AcrR family transcriptional regulator
VAKKSTTNRILQAALLLMKDKGFKAVSIKEIAHKAEVSEMTIFRHFATKKQLLEAVIEAHSIIPSFQKVIEEQMKWDLESDLSLIANTYLKQMEANRAIFLIAIQERTTMPEISTTVSKYPKQLMNYLSDYFQIMNAKQKTAIADPELQAKSFLTFLFGYFTSLTFLGDQFNDEKRETFLAHCVHTYCHGINQEKAGTPTFIKE